MTIISYSIIHDADSKKMFMIPIHVLYLNMQIYYLISHFYCGFIEPLETQSTQLIHKLWLTILHFRHQYIYMK